MYTSHTEENISDMLTKEKFLLMWGLEAFQKELG